MPSLIKLTREDIFDASGFVSDSLVGASGRLRGANKPLLLHFPPVIHSSRQSLSLTYMHDHHSYNYLKGSELGNRNQFSLSSV